jgi:hypothetical protein
MTLGVGAIFWPIIFCQFRVAQCTPARALGWLLL